MGNRLSKIYTRTGDDGTTGLGDGSRAPKHGPRVESYGTVDELNSIVGLVLTEPDTSADVAECLTAVQHRLFDLGGELCMPGHRIIDADDVESLENSLDRFNEELSPLKDFVVPGGTKSAALCHVARTVCRRAERRVWALAAEDDVNQHAARYLNRLSDLLFVVSRVLNVRHGRAEPLWQPKRKT